MVLKGFKHSEETKNKLRLLHIGKKLSEETKKKIGLKGLGRKHTEEAKKRMSQIQKGHFVSSETKEKISKSHKGKKVSEETKIKISKAEKGHPSWTKNVKIHTAESKLKISQANKGKNNYWYGKKLSPEHRKKISLANYKTGSTSISELIRHSTKYILWRSQIFERDNWTCQTCNKRGTYLEAHHKKEFIKILIEYNIKTIEEAERCLELWDLNNGVTLCSDCHGLTKLGKPKEMKHD